MEDNKMKKYTAKELRDFVDRAYTFERIKIAQDFLNKLTFNDKYLYYELMMDLSETAEALRKKNFSRFSSSVYEDDYGSCCPWNAPGMNPRDFI